MQNQEAGAAVEPGKATNSFGRLETRGIDHIPEVERKSKPSSLVGLFFGPQFGFGNMIFGFLPVSFGLGWWAAFTAITAGAVIGSMFFLALATISPRTGTNIQVSSGATFGVRARLLGSAIAWFIGVGFIILLVWTAGQSIVASFSRWFGTPSGTAAMAISIMAVLIVTCIGAILGHKTLEQGVKWISISSIIVFLALLAVFAPQFQVIEGGNYLLGSFWPTWFLSTTITATLPIAWAPFVGDYARYIPETVSPIRVGLVAFLSIFSGCWLAMEAAAFISMAFIADTSDFVLGVTMAAPVWFLIPMILVLGLGGNIASASMGLYNTSLDISAWPFFFRFSRWTITAGFSFLLFGLVYASTVIFDLATWLEGFVHIMVIVATPWVAIVALGHFWLFRGRYAPRDLHAFAIPDLRGWYWYTAGVNVRAILAWVCGVIVGLAFSSTALFVGPFVPYVQGVDISWLAATVAGGLVYWAGSLTTRKHWLETIDTSSEVGRRDDALTGTASMP